MAAALGILLAGGLVVALVFAAKSEATSTSSSTSSSSASTATSNASIGTGSVPQTGLLTANQREFAARLQSDTGLNPDVIAGWLLAEESGGAAQARDTANNNDWLNIGYTGAGTYGTSDEIWSSPTTAADATASWLMGQSSIPGYGTASQGIQNILSTAGQSISAQVSAIQNSGWAASGYPGLMDLVQEVTGT